VSADNPIRKKERGLSSPRQGGLETNIEAEARETDKALKEILEKIGV
jgi:hypothetical protein